MRQSSPGCYGRHIEQHGTLGQSGYLGFPGCPSIFQKVVQNEW